MAAKVCKANPDAPRGHGGSADFLQLCDGGVRFRILHSNQLSARTHLPVDVGESRFEDITDWLPRAAVELNQSQLFDRPKVRRTSVDFDPR